MSYSERSLPVAAKTKSHWYQFRLVEILLFLTIACIVCSALGTKLPKSPAPAPPKAAP